MIVSLIAAARLSTGDWLALLALVCAPLLFLLARIHLAQRRDRIGVNARRARGGVYDVSTAAAGELADQLLRAAVRARRPW